MASQFPCPEYQRDCECIPFPVRNFTQEEPDVPTFVGTFNQGPTTGTFFSPSCLGICVSETSQSDADECAERQALDCSGDAVSPVQARATNDEQTCVVECPDSTTFSWTVPPGTVASFWQADANARANGLACKRALEHRLCFTTASPLPNACVGDFTSIVIGDSGGTSPYSFALTSGSLPAGLSFDAVGLIQGTPTINGTSTFSVTVTDAIGSTQTKEFTLLVIEITSPSSLPNATQNSAYSETLTSVGNTFPVSWAITAGALPTGLSMPATGVISGTPIVAGTYNFTATLTDADDNSCSKDFTIEVIESHPLEYWKLDEVAGNRAGSVNGIDLVPFGAVGSDTGIIGNAWEWTSTIVTLESGNVAGLNATGSRSVSGWYRLDVRADLTPHNIFSWFFKDGGASTVASLHLWSDTNQFTLQLQGTVTLTLLCPFAINVGDWYFFHAYYDADTDKITLEINLVSQGTSGGTTTVAASVAANFALLSVLTGAGNEYRVDEIAVRDYLPSASELSAFYNGGAGHSWPL